MLFEDTYQTIATESEAVFSDKGSKFIAYLYPIHQLEEYKFYLQELKLRHPKARHFCWALRFSMDRSVFKLTDDGEPSGSAGRPILNCLLSADLTNVLAIVVRYFGGTLLGVPGLINAYKTSSQMAIAAAKIVQQSITEIYKIDFKYEQMNEIMRIVKEENISISESHFDNDCSMLLELRQSFSDQIIARFKNIQNSQILYLKIK